MIFADKGNIKEAEKYLNKTSDYIKSSQLTDDDRKAFEITNDLDRIYLQTLKKDIKGAEKGLEAIKQVIGKRQSTTEIEYLNFITGFLQFQKGNSKLALQHFQKTGEGNPYVWYWEAVAQEKIGNKEAANALYEKIANYNANSVSLALVREKAKSKM